MAIKTHPHDGDVEAFLASVTNEQRRSDAQAVVDLMRDITGVEPRMWGPSMIGFGTQAYTNTTGTNDWFVVGCSPRASALTIYGIWDAYRPDPRLEQLGPHTAGKGCLYVKKLASIDVDLLRTLVAEAWDASDRTE
ncbi:MAG TPA: DUF1801 domain-containing protein [Propionibacteriaceae bacterium]|nr:DUF1801 domain-containing protein [Propionibacteriaceae bacterium]